MELQQHFIDRHDAGRRLAVMLDRHVDPSREELLVLALPRGGVPVGYEVARALGAPLDVLFVRKLGAPGFPELGLGAVVDGEHPQRILNPLVVDAVQPPPGYIEAEEGRQLAAIEERRHRYRQGRAPERIEGRTVVLVDDGIATGGSVRAALQALSRSGARRTVLAVPVAPPGVLEQLPIAQDDVVCLARPAGFRAVGQYYRDFGETSDEEVVDLLARAAIAFSAAAAEPVARLHPGPGTSP